MARKGSNLLKDLLTLGSVLLFKVRVLLLRSPTLPSQNEADMFLSLHVGFTPFGSQTVDEELNDFRSQYAEAHYEVCLNWDKQNCAI